jgi:putative transposase
LVQEQRNHLPRLGTRKLYHQIKPELERTGISAGRDVLFNWLREEDLLIRHKRRYVVTTNSNHWMKKYPNLTRELKVTGPEQLWVSDITYIDTEEGWMYLSLITDAWSRKVVGYTLEENMEAVTVAQALTMALESKNPKSNPMHHSDRGIQYCSTLYTTICKENGLRISMTENGDPYENALAERMNRTFKDELGLGGKLPSKNAARSVVKEAIPLYNTRRPHLSLSMRTPAEVHRMGINFTKSPEAETGSAGEQPARNTVVNGNGSGLDQTSSPAIQE